MSISGTARTNAILHNYIDSTYLVKPRILGMAKYSYKKIHRKSIVRFFAKVNILKHAQMIALSSELKTDAF